MGVGQGIRQELKWTTAQRQGVEGNFPTKTPGAMQMPPGGKCQGARMEERHSEEKSKSWENLERTKTRMTCLHDRLHLILLKSL